MTLPGSLNIQTVIVELYEAADVPLPSAARAITPLGELIGGCNLTATELPNLTSRSAADFLLRRGGLTEAPSGLNDEALAGFIYASPSFGSIFVERNDIVVRRRFSVAHELGHYLLHFRPLLAGMKGDCELFLMEAMNTDGRATDDDAVIEPDDIPAGSIESSNAIDLARLLPPRVELERQANRFAVELLMPEPVVRELTEKYAQAFRGKDLIWRIATEMLVSRAALRWRMHELDLLEDGSQRVN